MEFVTQQKSTEDILDKADSPSSAEESECSSYRDVTRLSEIAILAEDEFRIALGLYIDDFEVANPLGTSKKKHKLCAVYLVLANLNPKYHSPFMPYS